MTSEQAEHIKAAFLAKPSVEAVVIQESCWKRYDVLVWVVYKLYAGKAISAIGDQLKMQFGDLNLTFHYDEGFSLTELEKANVTSTWRDDYVWHWNSKGMGWIGL